MPNRFWTDKNTWNNTFANLRWFYVAIVVVEVACAVAATSWFSFLFAAFFAVLWGYVAVRGFAYDKLRKADPKL